jgi:tetratricopeptide (TPR) repeat protein
MEPVPPDRRPPAPALLALLCAALALAVFSPVLDGGFLNWDDDLLILNTPAFRGLGWPQLRWMFGSLYFGLYMPLTWLSWAGDFALWGLEPFGYHLTSLLLHAANAAALFAVSRELLRLAGPSAAGGTDRPLAAGAVFSALLFALHPLRAEPVAWITERSVLLSSLFSLFCLLAHLRAGAAAGLRRRGWVLAWFAAALLSKGSSIILPGILLVLDFYPLRRLPGDPRRWRDRGARAVWLEKLPFLLLAAAIAVVGLAGQHQVGAAAAFQSWGLMPRLCQACYGLAFYLGKTLWPVGLSPVYEAAAPLRLWDWPYWGSAALAAGLTVAALRSRRRWPAGLALWAFYCITLLPVLGLVKIGHLRIIAADHYAYLSCMGWSVAAGAALAGLLRRDGRAARGIALSGAVAVLAMLGAASVRQAAVWKDSLRLWSAVLARDPDSSLAHGSLGQALIEEERWEEAIFHLRTQIARHPGEGKDVVNLQAALSRRRWRQADPARYFNNRGAELAGQGRYDEAGLAFSRSLQADPTLALTHLNMGLCLLRQGRPAPAALHLRRGAELESSSGR